jgi:hypothetical protein
MPFPRVSAALPTKTGDPFHVTVSSIQSEFLATVPEVLGSILGVIDFLRSSGSGTGSTHPREYN